jgi:hypothetical protein
MYIMSESERIREILNKLQADTIEASIKGDIPVNMTSPTDLVAVQEWMRSNGFVYDSILEDYIKKDEPDHDWRIPAYQAAFFYNVVQQQRVAAREQAARRIQAVINAHRGLNSDTEVLALVEASLSVVELLELEATLNQHNAPEGGDTV